MDWAVLLQGLQTVSVIAAILVAVGTIRGRKNDEVSTLTEMRVDIKYIKEKINDVDEIRERLTTVEQSAKSAHRRLDEHLNVKERV